MPPFADSAAAPPIPLTRLIGRDADVAAVGHLLAAGRLVTLTGPGGTGKTRVALQVAAEAAAAFPDGIAFVPLATLTDPDLVLPTIAATLGITLAGSDSPVAELRAALVGRRTLLVLDNFEQILDAAAAVVAVLAACPHMQILVTSREPLRVAGEQEFPVPPLAVPDHIREVAPAELARAPAVALFVERAHAVDPGFALTDVTTPLVAELCVRLDGLPLAIELAAARAKFLSLPELLTRLDRRLTLLTGGGRDLPARQRTLRETIDWSYRLLAPREQRLFARLAIFSGGCALDAAAAVCAEHPPSGEPVDVLDGIASLIDKSLIQPIGRRSGEARVGMLETLHEYARACLAASGEETAIARAHAAHFLALAEAAARGLSGADQATWLALLEREHDNCRSALAWALDAGEAELALKLCDALWWFWNLGGHYREGRTWMERALKRAEGAPPASQARVLDAVGFLIQTQGDYATARAYHTEGLAIFRTLEDRPGIARCLNNLAIAAQYQGDFAAARPLHEECLAIRRELGDWSGVAAVLNNLGAMAQDQGDHLAARAYLEESVAVARAAGDTIGLIAAIGNLGLLSIDRGEDAASGQALLAECLALFRELGYPARHGIAECLEGLATIAGGRRDGARAARLAGAAEALREAIAVPLAPAARARYDRALDDIRGCYDGPTWSASWSEGRALGVEQAVSYACALPSYDEDVVQAPPSPSYPAGLSPREVEVLRLVAAGQTNRAIADALFLSEHTVRSHVRSILTKTGTDNRTGAAIFAREHGIS